MRVQKRTIRVSGGWVEGWYFQFSWGGGCYFQFSWGGLVFSGLRGEVGEGAGIFSSPGGRWGRGLVFSVLREGLLLFHNNCINSTLCNTFIVLCSLLFYIMLTHMNWGKKHDNNNSLHSLLSHISCQGWEFARRFSERIACFLRKNEQMSDSLKKMSNSLIRSFLVSDLSKSLMVAHF